MSFLSPDSRFMRGLESTTDAIWLTILMAVTSLPVVTLGAAVTAGHDAARRSIIGQGHVTSNYFRAFRSDFMKSTLLWLVFGPVAAAVVLVALTVHTTLVYVPLFAVGILWLVGFEWVWAFQARFDNTVGGTLANAYVVGISHIGATLAMIAMDVVYVAIVIASWVYLPQGLYLLFLLGYGTLVMLHTPILERVFMPYVRKAAEASGKDPDATGPAAAEDATREMTASDMDPMGSAEPAAGSPTPKKDAR